MHGYHFYKVVERVGSSPDPIEGAIRSAIARANATPGNRGWLEVVGTRGHIESGAVHRCPGTLKVGVMPDDEPGSASPPDRRQRWRVT